MSLPDKAVDHNGCCRENLHVFCKDIYRLNRNPVQEVQVPLGRKPGPIVECVQLTRSHIFVVANAVQRGVGESFKVLRVQFRASCFGCESIMSKIRELVNA